MILPCFSPLFFLSYNPSSSCIRWYAEPQAKLPACILPVINLITAMALLLKSTHRLRPPSSTRVFLWSGHPLKRLLFPTSALTPKIFRPSSTQSIMATPSQTPEPLAKNIYFPDDDVECLEQYCFGGYHPTLIGDAFKDGRYTVVHKLGSGSCSTVWLARDNQQGRYVSLKIMVSAESSCQSESRIIRSLQRGGNAAQQGRRFISPLLDEFFTYGPNGRHLCLVGEPAGFHLAVSKEMSATGKFPVESARSMAAQLAMGLSYIHSRGICHGGEFCLSILHPQDVGADVKYRPSNAEHSAANTQPRSPENQRALRRTRRALPSPYQTDRRGRSTASGTATRHSSLEV